MNGARSILLVAMREISERLRGRATWVITAITTLLAVGLIAVPALVNRPAGPTVIGLVGTNAQALGPALQAAAKAAKIDITTTNLDSAATVQSELTPSQPGGRGSRPLGRLLQSLQGGTATIDVALTVDSGSATIEAYHSIPPTIAALLRATIEAGQQHAVLVQAGVPSSVIAAAAQPLPVKTVTLQPAPSDLAGREVAALAAGFLLYASVGIAGAAVATGVAQEKTSRTAEVLLAAVRPGQLMTGKVLGIGLVALGQMFVTVAAALATNAVVKSSVVPSAVGVLLPAILLWFILGFAFYAFGFAAAGAMVARQEEVQSVTMPFSVFLVGGFLLVYATVASPDAGWIRVLSYLPPLTPILMPARLALGHLAAWEMPVAAAIMLASTYGMARLAGRIYGAGLVRGGARLSWAAALRLR